MCVPILIFLLISYLILTSYFNQTQNYLKLRNNFFFDAVIRKHVTQSAQTLRLYALSGTI